MNKKQRNRKLVNQNNRNRLLNRKYKSLIRDLGKFLKSKIENYSKLSSLNKKEALKAIIFQSNNKLVSICDKAVKKKVYHKNTVARKKSKFQKVLNKNFDS